MYRLVKDKRFLRKSLIGLVASAVGVILLLCMYYWSPPEIRRRLTVRRWEGTFNSKNDPMGFRERQVKTLDGIDSFSILSEPKLVTAALFSYESKKIDLTLTFLAWNPQRVKGFLLEVPGHTYKHRFTEFEVDDFVYRAQSGKEIAFEALVQIDENSEFLAHLSKGCDVYLLDQDGNRLSPPVSLQIITPRTDMSETNDENHEVFPDSSRNDRSISGEDIGAK